MVEIRGNPQHRRAAAQAAQCGLDGFLRLDMFYSIRQYISDCNAYFSSITELKIRLDFDNVN